MELYQRELESALERLRKAGRDPGDFEFKMSFQEPDPDGAGMYTVRYDILVTHKTNGKTLGAVGGIGLRWVDDFEEALNAGEFD